MFEFNTVFLLGRGEGVSARSRAQPCNVGCGQRGYEGYVDLFGHLRFEAICFQGAPGMGTRPSAWDGASDPKRNPLRR